MLHNMLVNVKHSIVKLLHMFRYDEMIKKNYVYFTWLEIVGDIILKSYEPIFWLKNLVKTQCEKSLLVKATSSRGKLPAHSCNQLKSYIVVNSRSPEASIFLAYSH